jgi:hypothetical protein
MTIASVDTFLSVVAQLKKDRVILNDAEIVRLTGYSRSYISTLIHGVQPPGKPFLNKFNEVFLSGNAITTEVIRLRRELADKQGMIAALQATIDSQKELLSMYRRQGLKAG